MDPRLKASLLWGAVGTLSFLVLLQGYHVVAGEFAGFAVLFGVGGVVFLASTVATYLLRGVFADRADRT